LKFPFYFAYDTPTNFVNNAGLLNSKHVVADYYGSAAVMLLFQMACIGMLMASYLLFRKNIVRKIVDNLEYKFRNSGIIIFFIFAAGLFSAISLYRITGGNFLYLLSRRSGNTEAFQLLKDNFLIALFSNLILVLIPLYLSTKLLEKSKRWKWVFWLYIPAILLSFLITGARGFTIYSIGTSLIMIFSFKKVPIRVFLPFIPFLFVGFAVLGLLRRSSDTTNSKFSENIENQRDKSGQWYYELSNYQLQLRDEMIFSNLTSSNALYGQSYLNYLFFPIPRAWIGDLKPEFTDAYVAHTFWGRDDIGLPLNSMSEAYFNFGFFGLLVFVVLGIVMASITNSLTSKADVLRQSLTIILLVYAQTWATSEVVYILEFIFIIGPVVMFIRGKSIQAKTQIAKYGKINHY
jgi:oligosaccharide repeat unit polymerase